MLNNFQYSFCFDGSNSKIDLKYPEYPRVGRAALINHLRNFPWSDKNLKCTTGRISEGRTFSSFYSIRARRKRTKGGESYTKE